MSAKELRRAAEIALSESVEARQLYGLLNEADSPELPCEAVCRYILSTVREDDDEEYRSDWGRSVIGTSEVALNERFSLATHRCDIEYDDMQPYQVSCGSLRTRVKTQGDFRELCRLLGVALKEVD